MSEAATSRSWRRGGCYCRAVAFEALVPDEVELVDCNCSFCRMTGYLHLSVAKMDFRLLSGEDRLMTYSFGSGTAKHAFCAVCGIKSLYVPRSHPHGYSINFRCLDASEFTSVITTEFDGTLWEQNASKLAPLEAD